jgi:hypothetical protein
VALVPWRNFFYMLTRVKNRFFFSKINEKWYTPRKGRAGRTQPGVCYRLVRREFFKSSLMRTIPPEIERCPLEDCVLLGKSVFPDLTPHQFLKDACAVPKGIDINQGMGKKQR